MDEHIVSINQQKENILQFHVSIEGTDADDAIVRLVVDLHNGMMLVFPCVNLSGEEYEARIPALTHIERTAYPCFIEVITNGYYFKAMKGVVNVTSSATITAQPTTTFTKKSTTEDNKTTEDNASEKSTEESLSFFTSKPTNPSLGVKGVKDLAENLAADKIKPVEPTPKKAVIIEETVVLPIQTETETKDTRVKQVLESMGIVTKPKIKRNIPKLKINR